MAVSWIDELNKGNYGSFASAGTGNQRDMNLMAGLQPTAMTQPVGPQNANKKKKNFWVDQISTVGGILGGIGGSFVAPVAGTVGGAALGSALGQTLENALTGDKLSDNVVKEAALGGVFALPPLRAAKAAGTGLKAAAGAVTGRTAANAAEQATGKTLESAIAGGASQPLKTSIQGKLANMSDKLLSSQYGTISKPIARQTNPEETFGKLSQLGLTKPQDVERVADGITGANGVLNKAVVNATGNSKRVDVTGLREILTDSMANNGVVGTKAKELTTMFDAQMGKLLGGPKGSLDPTANPSDVLDVMKAMEARIAQKTGKGGNYRLPTDETVNQANALQLVKDELQGRLESGADVKNVLTPQLRSDLLNLAPNNKAWQSYVDSNVMKSKDLASLRSAQAPFVNARKIIDEADTNSMTFGGRMGNQAGSIKDALMNTLSESVKNPAARAASSVLKTASGAAPTLNQAVQATRPSMAGIAGRLGAVGAINGGLNQANQLMAPQEQGAVQMPQSDMASTISMPTGQQMEQPSAYPKENALADIQRDPKNADYYMQLYEFANPVQKQQELGATAANQLAMGSNAVGTIDQLEGLYGAAGGGSGKLGGTIRNKLAGAGFDGSAQTYNDLAGASVAQLSRALGAGNPSDADIAVLQAALPKITDSPQVAQAKFVALRARLQTAQRNALMYNTSSGGGNDLASALGG